jgi:hypothetical protein
MSGVRVQLPDRVPIHAGPPQRMPRQIGVAVVAKDFAVDLQIRASWPFMPPQRVLAEHTVFRFEYFSHSAGGSITWLSPSNTANSLVIICSSYCAAPFGNETLVEKSDARNPTAHPRISPAFDEPRLEQLTSVERLKPILSRPPRVGAVKVCSTRHCAEEA